MLDKTEAGARLSLDNATTCNIPSISTCFTTELSDDGLYCDEASGVLLQNISKDFVKTFLMNSNLIVCMVSLIVFLLVTCMISKGRRIKFARGETSGVVFVALVLILLLAGFVPFILFRVCSV